MLYLFRRAQKIDLSDQAPGYLGSEDSHPTNGSQAGLTADYASQRGEGGHCGAKASRPERGAWETAEVWAEMPVSSTNARAAMRRERAPPDESHQGA